MRQLIVNTFMSLDGVMQAPGDRRRTRAATSTRGGWSFGYWDEHMGAAMAEFMGKPFDLVLGRKTYEIFAAHWPYSDEPAAEPLNAATKYVASNTGVDLTWNRSELIEGDVAAGVRALKKKTARSCRCTARRTCSRR